LILEGSLSAAPRKLPVRAARDMAGDGCIIHSIANHRYRLPHIRGKLTIASAPGHWHQVELIVARSVVFQT
jgi:hypothetical protein